MVITLILPRSAARSTTVVLEVWPANVRAPVDCILMPSFNDVKTSTIFQLALVNLENTQHRLNHHATSKVAYILYNFFFPVFILTSVYDFSLSV